MAAELLPLLCHDAVLVPGSDMTLRLLPSVHGPLLRAAGSDGRFGMCLAEEQAMADVGVEARIDDFSTAPDGALALRVRGLRRFGVRRTSMLAGAVLAAVVDWREPDGDEPLRPEHALLAVILERILVQAGVDATATQLDDSAWVGWRLVEWLPLSAAQRQALLQEDDPFVRLDRLLVLLS